MRLIFKERSLQERASRKSVDIEATSHETLQRFVALLHIAHEGEKLFLISEDTLEGGRLLTVARRRDDLLKALLKLWAVEASEELLHILHHLWRVLHAEAVAPDHVVLLEGNRLADLLRLVGKLLLIERQTATV